MKYGVDRFTWTTALFYLGVGAVGALVLIALLRVLHTAGLS